jgi:transcriptional regulator with XRE-family HTH domain
MTLVNRVAARIKRLREQRGLTQAQLAAKAGISRAYLARIETARHHLTVPTLERLAKALRVRPARFLE